MARKIAEGTSINPTSGRQHTEWVELETFSGTVALFASGKEDGAKEAKQNVNVTSKVSFSTDDSTVDFRRIVGGVAFLDPD